MDGRRGGQGDHRRARRARPARRGARELYVVFSGSAAFTVNGETFDASTGTFVGYFATGEYDKALEFSSEAHAEFPDDGGVRFNMACAESLLGRTEDAIGHLEQSIESDESFRELARKDTDFDSIRDDPRFRELVS